MDTEDQQLSTESSSDKAPLDALGHAAITDVGRKRDENQDFFGIIKTGSFHFYVVADGMGGANGGAVASRMLVEILEEKLEETEVIDQASLTAMIEEANKRIFEKASGNPGLSGMGTTLVALAFVGKDVYICNVGDSRAYRFRGYETERLSEDHTVVTELLKSGAINEEQAKNHPVSHMLTRSLGPTPEIEVDCVLLEDGPCPGDVYLLCSDGLYNLVSSSEMAQMLQSLDPQSALQEMVDLANERGGPDNITIIVIEIGDNFALNKHSEPESQDCQNGHLDELFEENKDLKSSISFQDFPHSSSGEDGSREQATVSSENRPQQSGYSKKEARKKSSVAGFLGIALALSGAALFGYFIAALELSTDKMEHLPLAASIEKGFEAGINPPSDPGQGIETEVLSIGLEAPLSEQNKIGQGLAVSQLPLATSERETESGLPGDEIQSIKRRHALLQKRLAELDERVKAFDQPLSGRIGEKLNEASRDSERLQSELSATRLSIDEATRRLAMWHGRKRRLESTDPINLAQELSSGSQSVKIARETFEQVTWEYLKEAEVLRYRRDDLEQERTVAALMQKRTESMRALALEVISTIDSEVSAVDNEIVELTISRHDIESQIEQLEKDLRYYRVLMTGSEQQRKEALNEILREKEVSEAERSNLERLLPELAPQG